MQVLPEGGAWALLGMMPGLGSHTGGQTWRCLGLVPTPGVKPGPHGGKLAILAFLAWLSHGGQTQWSLG